MRLLTILFTGIFLLSSTNTAQALDIDFGPTYWDVEDLDAAWGASVRLSQPVHEWVDVTFGAGWLFGEEDLADDDFMLIPIDLGLKVHLTSGCDLAPYLLAGASYVSIDNDHDFLPRLDGDWGAYTGAGVSYPLNDDWKVYSDVIFRFVNFDIKDAPGHINGHGLQATAGLSYTF
jgi:hypothetical protein